MSDEDAYLMLVRTASKKGYGIVLDDNVLAQLAANIPEEENEDKDEYLETTETKSDFVLEDEVSEIANVPTDPPVEQTTENLVEVPVLQSFIKNDFPLSDEVVTDIPVQSEKEIAKTAKVKSKKTKAKELFDIKDDFVPDSEPDYDNIPNPDTEELI
jgi:predicted nucleotidyltransferase component of viral defense system